jgi:hypothetical protein
MSNSSIGTKDQPIDSGTIGTITEWKTMYKSDKNDYESTALYAEV